MTRGSSPKRRSSSELLLRSSAIEASEASEGENRVKKGSSSEVGPRYVVGIDLGTTHTGVPYAPIPTGEAAEPGAIAVSQVMPIPQLVAQGTLDSRELLPSFFYVAHESDGAQALPWDAKRTYVVGEHARARGVDAPARVVASAKSWLCHPSIDRRSAILPPGA